ncbi:MAG: Succinylglutamate desuccinylase / Aspartoacylase family protein [Lentisphaerae bacterium ADurb.Bin242]|nr:MAG: Succinylglutamate desuccinylase / Aspartoacylase family protein [Lentisphaerae bacterium ADurb.Bin242]
MNRIVKTFLEMPEYCGNLKLRLPLWIAEGSPGKSVFLCAAQHGRELHGTAALSEVFSELPEIPLTGTVVMMPLMNPLGVRMRMQDFPSEESRISNRKHYGPECNMNRLWTPGGMPGSVQSALTSLIYERHVKNADAVLDIHGWNGGSSAWSNEACLETLLKLGLRMVSIAESDSGGMLVQRAREDGKAAFTVEIEQQNRIVPSGHRLACRIVRNFLKAYGVIPGSPELPREQFVRRASGDLFLEAPVTGLAVPLFEAQEVVPAGAEYLRILSVETGEVLWKYVTEEEYLSVYSGTFQTGPGSEATSIVEKGMPIAHLTRAERIINN